MDLIYSIDSSLFRMNKSATAHLLEKLSSKVAINKFSGVWIYFYLENYFLSDKE